MIHEVLPSDVDFAREQLSSEQPEAEIVSALAARGVGPAKATQLLDDLRNGRKPAVQILVVPRSNGNGSRRSHGSARREAPHESPAPSRRSGHSGHRRAGVPGWFLLLAALALLAFA